MLRLLTLLMLNSFAACATEVVTGPKSCEIDERDPYEPELHGRFFKGPSGDVGLFHKGGPVEIALRFKNRAVGKAGAIEGSPMLLTLADGKTVHLRAVAQTAALKNIWRTISAPLGPDDLRRIAERGVTQASLRVGERELHITLSGNDSARLQTLAHCFYGGY